MYYIWTQSSTNTHSSVSRSLSLFGSDTKHVLFCSLEAEGQEAVFDVCVVIQLRKSIL